MTALCGGGTSGPNAIAEPVTYFAGSALTDMVVTALGLSEPWAAILGFIVGEQFNVSTLCVTDPPPMPTFSAVDIAAIITESEAESPTSFQKLHDLIQNGAWRALCQCTSPPQPAPPTPPVYPTGAPVVNPPGYGTGTASPCWTVTHQFNLTSPPNTTGQISEDISSIMLPAGNVQCTIELWTIGGPGGGPLIANVIQLPAGVSNMTINYTPLSATDNAYFRAFLVNSSCVGFGTTGDLSYSGGAGPGGYSKTIQTLPSGTTAMVFGVADSNTGTTTLYENYSVEFSFYCGGMVPSTPVQPCCPPDDTLLGLITAMKNELDFIYSSLPVRAPSYAALPAHTGLSGEGTQTLASSTTAIRVDVTTWPSGYGMLESLPTLYWDIGFVTPVTNQGPEVGQPIKYATQVFQLPEATDEVFYALPAGEQISITELQPG